MGMDRITVSTARWLCNTNKLDGVVIIAIGQGAVKSVSYGATVRQCRQLGRLIDAVGAQIDDGRLPLTEFEREDAL